MTDVFDLSNFRNQIFVVQSNPCAYVSHLPLHSCVGSMFTIRKWSNDTRNTFLGARDRLGIISNRATTMYALTNQKSVE